MYPYCWASPVLLSDVQMSAPAPDLGHQIPQSSTVNAFLPCMSLNAVCAVWASGSGSTAMSTMIRPSLSVYVPIAWSVHLYWVSMAFNRELSYELTHLSVQRFVAVYTTPLESVNDTGSSASDVNCVWSVEAASHVA